MKISVIVPTHNRQDKLKETIARLRKQDFSADQYEIIVVDDGSKIPVCFAKDLIISPAVSIIRLTGVERSIARNTGANRAKGEILIFVDDDIFVETNFLTTHWQAHQEFPDTLVVGAICLPEENQNNPFVRFRQKLENSAAPPNSGIIKDKNFCSAQNVSIKKSLFDEISGFDIRFTSSEDQDLALRHTALGKKIVFEPKALAVHNDNALDIRTYCRRNEWGSLAMLPFYERYPNIPSNVEREDVNGYVKWGKEPVWRSFRKISNHFISLPIVIKPLFRLAKLLEQIIPDSKMLIGIYHILLGAHIFRGYRKAIKQLNQNSNNSK